MSSCSQFGLILVVLINISLAAISNDEVKKLPGWQSQLPSKQYSGLLQIPNSSPNRYYHYYFVQSQSIINNNPYSDPFIVWFNGGPGASSLQGLFTEMGVFHLNDYSLIYNVTGIPQLWYNQYTWSTFANMLYIESPAGVGFSYCDGNEGPHLSCPTWNDSATAKDNYQVLKEFFKGYPEYLNNSQFYLSGESYAGVYVPTLVMEIENNNNFGLPPLKGFAIGNGCMGVGGQGGCDEDQIGVDIFFMYGHGQVSTKVYNEANKICGNSIFYGNWTNLPLCEAYILKGLEGIGGYDVYNLYDPCWEKNYTLPYFQTNENYKKSLSQNVDYNTQYACGVPKVFEQYMHIEQVKEAIHVPKTIIWRQEAGLDYVKTQKDLRPWYNKTIHEGKYKILIYNGDVDTAVPTYAADLWTYNLGFEIYSNEEWRPWTTDGKMDMGGYVTVFDTKQNFTFATIRGAGHMVPQYKPRQIMTLIKAFITGSAYPRFVPS